MSELTLRAAPADIDQLRDHGDALVLVATAPLSAHLGTLGIIGQEIAAFLAIDDGLTRANKSAVIVPARSAPGGRVVVSLTNTLTDETDDVRSLAEAASLATLRAVDAGAKRPVLALRTPSSDRFARGLEVATLAALGTRWAPLEARQANRAPKKLDSLAVSGLDVQMVDSLLALEAGRALARDIGGTEPERMAPIGVTALCSEIFAGTRVKVTVEEDVTGYPLLAAVARASMQVPRHQPRVVQLELLPTEPVTRTIILVGKGVTYDTGGSDLKTDGAMAGMSRDKGGAAAVAGLLLTLERLAIPGLRAIGLLGLVRNSIGEDAFVSDEIIVSRAGIRVRIGNTDAEGRLVLADLLHRAKELALEAVAPVIGSIATLTGHAYRAYGPYVAAIGNAAANNTLDAIAREGEQWGEPMERSRLRREDYGLVVGKSAAEDAMSCNRLASVATPRGHQFPFAFLDVASGLRGSGLGLFHLDIAGAAMDPPDWQLGRPTGSPILSLAAWARG